MNDMHDRFRFNLVYDGPALEEHRMDVRTLAPALLALGDMVERANEILNGEQVKIRVDVHASFREGSFGVDMDLVQSLWQKAIHFASEPGVITASMLAGFLGFSARDGFKGVIQVITWLRGRAVRKVEPIDGGKVLFYVDGDAIEVEEKVYELLRDYKVRRALQDVVNEPLRRDGIETVAAVDKQIEKVGFMVSRSDSAYFRAPEPEDEPLQSDEYTATLQVLTLAFQDGNKWRFTEGGGNTYYATILDEKFLQRIRSNESFARDDIIRARVRRTQKITKDGLKADYEVVEVLEHRSVGPRVQLGIDFSEHGSDA